MDFFAWRRFQRRSSIKRLNKSVIDWDSHSQHKHAFHFYLNVIENVAWRIFSSSESCLIMHCCLSEYFNRSICRWETELVFFLFSSLLVFYRHFQWLTLDACSSFQAGKLRETLRDSWEIKGHKKLSNSCFSIYISKVFDLKYFTESGREPKIR